MEFVLDLLIGFVGGGLAVHLVPRAGELLCWRSAMADEEAFSDLIYASDEFLSWVLREGRPPLPVLGEALRGADPALRERLLGLLDPEASAVVSHAMRGNRRLSQVRAAQCRIGRRVIALKRAG